MAEAVELTSQMLKAKKMTLFCIGIGDEKKKTFPWLDKLLEHDWRDLPGGSSRVATSVEGLVSSMEYIGRTILQDSAGASAAGVKSQKAVEMKKLYTGG